MAALGRWRIGGPAALVVTPGSAASLAAVIGLLAGQPIPHAVIGDGTNLLFPDEGFGGVLVRIGRALSGFRQLDDGHVEAEAGLWVPTFVHRLIRGGLAGAVHAIGIPGTLGGLVTMNGGSQRHGIGEHVVDVDLLGRDGIVRRVAAAEMGFAYRRSRVTDEGGTILSARFRFAPGDRAALHAEARAILADRRAKFPRVRANCGSVFVSDPALYERIGPPGRAIEACGLKGLRIGQAQISPDHANFIVNLGGARAADVLALVALARTRVAAATGVAMRAEVRYLNADGTMVPAHEVAAPAAAALTESAPS